MAASLAAMKAVSLEMLLAYKLVDPRAAETVALSAVSWACP